uniref:Uncharacterized protein n=1 Tax=Timema shepardi TaxID=629360 RepID=A0A7R9G6U0_TIMSH|nr:unnamed protein product [Timema shepardi]
MMQRVTSRSTCHTCHSFSHVFTLGAHIVRAGTDVVDETRDTLTEKRGIFELTAVLSRAKTLSAATDGSAVPCQDAERRVGDRSQQGPSSRGLQSRRPDGLSGTTIIAVIDPIIV